MSSNHHLCWRSLSHVITLNPHVIFANLCPRTGQGGTWKLEVQQRQAFTHTKDVGHPSHFIQCGKVILDVEVRFEQQHSRLHGMHKTFVSFCLNGAVPLP